VLSAPATLDVLRAIPLFASCTDDELELVASAAERATYRAGEPLISEGEEGWEFFVLTAGSAEVTRGGRRLATIGVGEFVGELSLLDGGTRNASVTALEDVEVLLLAYDEFWEVISRAPGLDKKLLAGMARRLRESEPLFP
jgi:CRP/FNR family transcriptional regulator, cyclic AMP receptor protein